MIEIILLPYLAISSLIGWAIFSPFGKIEGIDQWSFARVETGDLLAIFLPIGALLGLTNWSMAGNELPKLVLGLILATIFLFALFTFAVGLFLIAKLGKPPSAKRMATIGLIVPLGTLLTIAWFAIPMLSYAESSLYSAPATLAIFPVTFCLRALSTWVCQRPESRVREKLEL
ncbi:MAG: hypothetical protein AAF456_12930 [Planctomycetota bacterium]